MSLTAIELLTMDGYRAEYSGRMVPGPAVGHRAEAADDR